MHQKGHEYVSRSKAQVCEMTNHIEPFSRKLLECARPRIAFDNDQTPVKSQTSIDATIYGVLISVRHYALPQMRVT
jgi:hypothetical protein